ncbi:MAG: FecR family protein [Tannerella sp.]|jgi:ferric-dicitrate binding protein FerR (iron transport regulator)|nr:FecR family protein [Tannerella sp.]
MGNPLFELLGKWMFGKLDSETFKQLRSKLKTASEEQLRQDLERLWNDPRTPEQMDMAGKAAVWTRLEHHAQASLRSRRLHWLRIAAILLLPVLLLGGGAFLYLSGKPTEGPAALQVMTAAGQKSQVLLPDGSRVWLNAGSILTYPCDFGRKERRVRLEGEAYFEVTKDARKAFRVEAEGLQVVVHGTKFNVAVRQGDSEASVSLLEGSVSVEDRTNRLLASLKPEQSFLFDQTDGHFKVRHEDTALTAVWIKDTCRVKDASDLETFKKIGYWYGLHIRLENSRPDYKYNFTIHSESFREFMALINKLTPLAYTMQGDEVVVRYLAPAKSNH